MASIDDFLALKFSDGIIDGDKVSWNIAPSYYSNQRSSVCFMSLERCNIVFKGESGLYVDGPRSTTLRININGQNQQCSDNNDTVLDVVGTTMRGVKTSTQTTAPNGIVTVTNTIAILSHTAAKYSNENPMRLLVSARPTSIVLTIANDDLLAIEDAGVIIQDYNSIILRFEYENLKETIHEFKSQFQKTF